MIHASVLLSGASGFGQEKNPPSAKAGRPERAQPRHLKL